MIDVTVVVPESRLAEFYQHYGKWLGEQQQKSTEKSSRVESSGWTACSNPRCLKSFPTTSRRRKYCSKYCQRRVARERRASR